MTIKYELCQFCTQRTGRGGRGEDSIYRTLIKDYYPPGNCGDVIHAENEVGPLCEDCRDALVALRVIEE